MRQSVIRSSVHEPACGGIAKIDSSRMFDGPYLLSATLYS